jgi:hypothetical protein
METTPESQMADTDLDRRPIWHFKTSRQQAQQLLKMIGLYLPQSMYILDDLIDNLRVDDTEEGRVALALLKQGLSAWLDARTRKDTASTVAESFGEGFEGKEGVRFEGYQTFENTAAKLADSIHHPYGFKSNAATIWGNVREARVADVGMLRLSMALRQLGLPCLLKVLHMGIEATPGHPYVGFSTDGNVSWYEKDADGKEKLIAESILEIKNPTFMYPGVRTYHWAQQQLEMGLSGKLWCDYIVSTPKTTTISRINFDPYFFFEVILPRIQTRWIDMLVPAILYTYNTGQLPDWLPSMDDPDEQDSCRDPNVVFKSDIEAEASLGSRVYIPPPDIGIPAEGKWNWEFAPEEDDQSKGLDEETQKARKRLTKLTKERWDPTWTDQSLLQGYFSSVPFVFEMELEDMNPIISELVRRARENEEERERKRKEEWMAREKEREEQAPDVVITRIPGTARIPAQPQRFLQRQVGGGGGGGGGGGEGGGGRGRGGEPPYKRSKVSPEAGPSSLSIFDKFRPR